VRSGGVPAVSGDEGVSSLEIAIRCLEAPPKPAGQRPANLVSVPRRAAI
jgi:hypothetical protein